MTTTPDCIETHLGATVPTRRDEVAADAESERMEGVSTTGHTGAGTGVFDGFLHWCRKKWEGESELIESAFHRTGVGCLTQIRLLEGRRETLQTPEIGECPEVVEGATDTASSYLVGLRV